MASDYRKIGLMLGVCACALLGAQRVHAQASAADKAAAEALFDRGLTLLREGKYQEACERLEQSQSIERGIGTMLYLAECYEKIGRTASAWALFREASSLAQAAGQGERAEAGKRRAERLEKGLSKLTIQVDAVRQVPGLEIQDNGLQVHPSVWGVSVPVDPGPHKVDAKAPGYRPWSGTVKVEDHGASAELRLPALERLPDAPLAPAAVAAGAAASAPATPPEPEHMSGLRMASIAVGSAGVVGLVMGTAFGVRALKKNDDAKQEGCSGATCSTDQGVKLSDQALTAARASNALLAIGGVLTVGGIVMFFTAPEARRGKADKRSAARRALPNMAVRVDRYTAGLSLGGVF